MNTGWLFRRRFELLLLSFLVLMFGITFLTTPIAMHVLVTQNLIAGLLVFYLHKQLRYVILSILCFHTFLIFFAGSIPWLQQHELKPYIYVLYFSLISFQVYKHIFQSRTVSTEMISAVMCGFILLCFISTFIFDNTERMHPNSFSNIGTGRDQLVNLDYFSVTTLLTTGFGDIVPLTVVAKRYVMLMALLGHFYTVFVTAIVIGKYLNSKSST